MLEALAELGSLRILLAFAMLGFASMTDITKREISDFVWILFGGLGVVLLFFESDFFEAISTVGIAMIVAPVSLIIWRLGLFGGADAFALIVLAIIAPQLTLSENIVTPFTTLTNAVLVSIVPLFVNFGRNLIALLKNEDIFEGFNESRNRRIFAIFVGYRAKNPKFGFSIEKKVGKKKKLNLALHHAENAEFCNTPNTWITPGIPYMLFITAGFAIQLFFGDIIFNFLQMP